MPDKTWMTRGGRAVPLPPFLVAGIINITPDSFSDGGLFFDCGMAVEHALDLWAEGASVLDLGGESTRPGADFVEAAEEVRRLRPVQRALTRIKTATEAGNLVYSEKRTLPEGAFPLISIDTWRSSTARAALEDGADIINDISGAAFDPEMPSVLAEYRPGYILGHSPEAPRTMQRAPFYRNVVEDIYAWFSTQANLLVKAGLPQECIALDPGLGFGKTMEHNLEILRNIERFHSLGFPLCAGVSRKRLLGEFLGLEQGSERDTATQVIVALTAERGVQIHRVHAARGAVNALKLAAALHKKSSGETNWRG